MLNYKSRIWWRFLVKPNCCFFEDSLLIIMLFGVLTIGLNSLCINYLSEAFNMLPLFHFVLGLIIGISLIFITNLALKSNLINGQQLLIFNSKIYTLLNTQRVCGQNKNTVVSFKYLIYLKSLLLVSFRIWIREVNLFMDFSLSDVVFLRL